MRALVSLDGNEVEIIVGRIIQGKKSRIVGYLPTSMQNISVTIDKLIELRLDNEETKFADYCRDIIYFCLVCLLAIAIIKYIG